MSTERAAGLTSMTPAVLLPDLAFPESPRWRDGQIYVSDWGTGTVWSVTPTGDAFVAARGTAFPLCIDFLPDGRLLLVDGSTLRVQDPDGNVEPYADLSQVSTYAFNDVAVDAAGRVYVNNIGFDFPGGEPRPGLVAVVTEEGAAREAADGLMFPNGMAVVDETLIVAESYADRLTAFQIGPGGSLSGRRDWAVLGEGEAPDGICVVPEGIWYASVPQQACTLVAEGGEVLARQEFDRGAFSCTVGDGVLYVALNAWGSETDQPQGQLVAVEIR
jgi:sugar lactone lactonase YvrE